MTTEEFRIVCQNTRNNDLDIRDQILNAGMGIGGEAGEIVDLLKKHVFHSHVVTRSQLTEELGDLLYYVDWLMEVANLNLADVMQANADKLALRYPSGFDPERSINRG